jgi:hypothetical protein
VICGTLAKPIETGGNPTSRASASFWRSRRRARRYGSSARSTSPQEAFVAALKADS